MTTEPESQKTKTTEADQATRTATRISIGVMVVVVGAALFGLQKRAPEAAASGAAREGKAFRGSVTRLSGSGALEACDPTGNACRKLEQQAVIPAGSRVRTDYRTRAELGLEDGSVLLRNSLMLAGGARVTDAQCEALIRIAIETCERYYPSLQFVVWAGKSAEEALESSLLDTMGEA